MLRRTQKNQLLLLEDVDGIGRSGDVVSVKPGFARNYLLPQKKAIAAQKHTIRLQEKLKAERAERAIEDKKHAEIVAEQLQGKTIQISVKIDAEGHMYGSVSAQDIANLLKEQLHVQLEKRNVMLPKPIKEIGTSEITLKLKEGVPAKVILQITAEEKPA
jgi:large subunit ribosomal protein L9